MKTKPSKALILAVTEQIKLSHPSPFDKTFTGHEPPMSAEDSYARASANALLWAIGILPYHGAPEAIRNALDRIAGKEKP